MKQILDKIEDDIKSLDDHELRLAFCIEQTTHAYTNIFVEKYREWGLPKPQELGRVTALFSFATPIPLIYFAYLSHKHKKILS
jgi:hypothetical protein